MNTNIRKLLNAGVLAAGALLAASSATAQVQTHPNTGTFPIANAVEVGPNTSLVFHSGVVPGAADPDAERGTPEFYGDTYTQSISVFERTKENLENLGLTMGDVIKMTVFLVGDPALDGQMDFQGFMDAYTQYFGTEEQPNLPARSALQVAGLVGPLMFVEVEVVTARYRGDN